MNEKIDRLAHVANEVSKLSDEIEEDVEAEIQKFEDSILKYFETSDIEEEHIPALREKPYAVVPKSKNEAFVVVPRFIPFNVGWLHDQDEAWNYFVVNKYVNWITELPEKIRDEVGIKPQFEKAKVEDGEIEFSSEDERERAWESLDGRNGGLSQRRGENKIKIKNGKEFEVMAELIDRGNLPFTARPVNEDKLRSEPENIELRDYQERAFETFLETGHIGIYWCPGAGKTFIALYIGDRLPGEKLVVVPTATLRRQWRERINEFCRNPSEWDVQTYQYITQHHLEEYQNKEFELTVFDENHHLPANSFSKLATLNTQHRLGLSASPYREDGRTEYIFALTGQPVGLKWRELIELGAVSEPDVFVYLYSTSTRKKNDLEKVLDQETGRKLVFCDSISKGKKLAKRFNTDFIHGETKHSERMDKARKSLEEDNLVFISRVGDEGLSLSDLDVVIEFDFHGQSRRQSAQRLGRGMHSDGEGKHIVMMTDEELEKFEKRLYAIEGEGFQVNYVRRK